MYGYCIISHNNWIAYVSLLVLSLRISVALLQKSALIVKENNHRLLWCKSKLLAILLILKLPKVENAANMILNAKYFMIALKFLLYHPAFCILFKKETLLDACCMISLFWTSCVEANGIRHTAISTGFYW